MSNKLIITNIEVNSKEKLFCGLKNDKRFYKVDFSDNESRCQVGDIFIGRVIDIAKNINAAFIEYQKGMRGYFSIEENKNIIFLNKKNTDKVCQGDLLIVQLSKAAVKTKFPVLTSLISLTGRNVVLNIGKSGIGFSGKIKDKDYKSEIQKSLGTFLENILAENKEEYGVIVRTNAYGLTADEISKDLQKLVEQWKNIKIMSRTRTALSCLKSADTLYMRYINGAYDDEIQEIVTDREDIYNEIKNMDINNCKITLYNDELLPLYKLHSVESVIEQVTNKKVWLKSGAYLVMEPTEAMYVIDVNTGKCIKGKKNDETIFNVNMEAAKEVAYQLQLRNISGIIVVDFINMESQEKQSLLMEYLDECVKKDKIKTTVVDITKLNLVEITRKKIESPVYEQIK